MATALVVAPPRRQAPIPQAWFARPPRPPHGVTVVFLDQFEVGSELMVEIDPTDLIKVSLKANGIDVSGAAPATVRHLGDASLFALADVPVAGFDSLAQRGTKGRVSIGLTIETPGSDEAATVAASALAEGDWTGGLLRFSKVARHNLQRRTIWLSTPVRRLRGPSDVCAGDGESTRLRWS